MSVSVVHCASCGFDSYATWIEKYLKSSFLVEVRIVEQNNGKFQVYYSPNNRSVVVKLFDKDQDQSFPSETDFEDVLGRLGVRRRSKL